jgi:hypothetical protein
MKLLILDTSQNINFETIEFINTLGKKNVLVHIQNKEKYLNDWFYECLEEYDDYKFVQDQIFYDAVYVTNSGKIEFTFRIPYFYNIYANTYSSEIENNFNYFNYKYSKVKGATAVFVNDRKLNKFSNWVGLNSYFINKPIDTNKFKFTNKKKFLTPKLNIAFIPSLEISFNINRNRFIEDLLSAFKSNWILHIPQINQIEGKNIISYDIIDDYQIIYDNSHLIINPENFQIASDISYENYCYQAMANGCIPITPNFNNIGNDYIFDKVHYFKMDFVDVNTTLNILRYADKRREKLERMSLASKDIILKYFNVKKIVQQKIQIIKSYI